MVAAFLVAYLLVVLADLALDLVNLAHLRRHGSDVPPELEGYVDAAILARTEAYHTERTGLGIVSSATTTLATVLFLFTGAVALYDGWIATLAESFIGRGMLFFLGLTLAGVLLGVPFSLWSNFVIEERYDFNRKTFRIWLGDQGKSLALSALLVAGLAGSALAFLQRFPETWWLWFWGFFLVFQLAMLFLAPWILRLFFRFKPLEGREALREAVRNLAKEAGIRVKGIFQVDSSRRTSHTNAFFTGLGSSKRIALFDTLLAKLEDDEILAVLAHEMGHWRKRHGLKRLGVTAMLSLAGLFVASQLLVWGGLGGLIGLPEASVYVELVVLSLLNTIVTFPLEPLRSAFSRRNEREADRIASSLTGKPSAMASALAKLSRDNLSNLHPHPLYAWFHLSHPPDPERIGALRDEKGNGDA